MNKDLETEKIFYGFNEIRKNDSASLNTAALNYLIERKLLDDWSIGFYSNNINKKEENLTDKQKHWRKVINRKIVQMIYNENTPTTIEKIPEKWSA